MFECIWHLSGFKNYQRCQSGVMCVEPYEPQSDKSHEKPGKDSELPGDLELRSESGARSESESSTAPETRRRRRNQERASRKRGRRHWGRLVGLFFGALLFAVFVCAMFFVYHAFSLKEHVTAVREEASALQSGLLTEERQQTARHLTVIASHLLAAEEDANSLSWRMASLAPYVGSDIRAVRTLAAGLGDIANNALPQLEQAVTIFSVQDVAIADGAVSLPNLAQAAPHLTEASTSIHLAAQRLTGMPEAKVPELRSQIDEAKELFRSVDAGIEAVANFAEIAPQMLGLNGEAPRSYLVLSQNNAELRPRGGMPGSWGIVTSDNGKLGVEPFVSVGELGWMKEPVVKLSVEEEQLFTSKLARIGQDVNFTPDFPRTGEIAKAMWMERFGREVDGVIAIDPAALQHVLAVTGPVMLSDGTTLDGENAEEQLLHQVYLEKPVQQQDAFFAEAAAAAFTGLMTYRGSPLPCMLAIAQSASEGHVLLWSAHQDEQRVLNSTGISGVLVTETDDPRIGVYFTDQTQSKMDWFLRREVSIVSERVIDGAVREYEVEVSLSNTMTEEQVGVMPRYVLGGSSNSQLRPGSIDTAIYLYAPAGGGIVESQFSDGGGFDSISTHEGLTVGLKTVILEPGQSMVMKVHVQSSVGVLKEARLEQTPYALGR
ncbi:MAG: DUF4012 domain-containing protein [Bifidobacterium crudilactis]|nr:DUF4012 domain-containing protein [Bifidobacterium crudilactis]